MAVDIVPSQLSTTNHRYRIACIGQNPGEFELSLGQNFIGPAGDFLLAALHKYGSLQREDLFLGNILNYQPVGGVSKLTPHDYNVELALEQLRKDLQQFQPNIVILLGWLPLRFAKQANSSKPFHAAKNKDFPINAWRGSLFKCTDPQSPFFGYKCLATFNPADVINEKSSPSNKPLFLFDVKRAVEHSETPQMPEVKRELITNVTLDESMDLMHEVEQRGEPFAMDIEGYSNDITCVSIASSAERCFIVPFQDFSSDRAPIAWRKFSRLMYNPDIGKVLQNSIYDAFCLAFGYKCLIRNIVGDTMFSGWEMFPELKKSLGMQTSIWTLQPYYKDTRTSGDKQVFYKYCCLDSACTYEIWEKQLAYMTEAQKAHVKLNLQLLQVFLYMALRGINYDKDLAATRMQEILTQQEEALTSMKVVVSDPDFNPRSNPQLMNYLYMKLGFEKQFKIEGGRKTNILTADEEALLKLAKKYSHPFLVNLLRFRKLEGFRKQLAFNASPVDGRMRSSYNPVGTSTGRLSSSQSNEVIPGGTAKNPKKSGANLQTITKQLRVLYRADPGNYMFQCDLKGADGWTVAARAADLGDPTMLDDYFADIKPARVIGLLRLHGREVNTWSRERIVAEGAAIDDYEDGWLYFAAKRIQHGTNYGLGRRAMVNLILKDSYKYLGRSIAVKENECALLQQLYLYRYPGVKRWQEWVKKNLHETQTLPSASGHVRTFFGNPNFGNVINEALSHEPQHNTTYATNLALLRLWEDPENRGLDGSFIIEPLHQVHDAMIGQFPIERTEWAKSKLYEYFNNPITIGSVTLTIPFDGEYGPSWGNLKTGKILL